MSITAIGPALNVDGPLPVAPEHGLLTIPGVVDQSVDRWMNGVNVWGYPEGVPALWEPCSAGTNRTKDDTTDQSVPRFDAFGFYVPMVCSAMNIRDAGGDWQAFAGRAAKVLKATASFAVAKALSQGVQFSANPFLADGNVSNLNSGAAVKPESAIAFLENAIGATGRQGLIHLTPGVAGYLGYNLLRECDPDGVDDSGDEYLETINGTPVAADGGYIGAATHGFNGSAPGAGNDWAFATGPVKVFLSPFELVAPDLMQSMDQLTNDVVVRAEGYALAMWDTALQAAVKVDYTP